MASLPVVGIPARCDSLWDHCRNSLGIARLLVHEGRPEPLVATACRMAVETACRAALEQAGLPSDGDLTEWVRRLPMKDLLRHDPGVSGARLLAVTEKTVGRVAAYLRTIAPGRTWGF